MFLFVAFTLVRLLTGCLCTDIWCPSARGRSVQSCRAGIGREGENESESGENPEAQHERFHQQVKK